METFFKSFSNPRDQLSPIPPDEYAARFVKFIRANTKPRDEPKQRTDDQQPASPLTTIEEHEDKRILEKAERQLRKERSLNGIQRSDDIDIARVKSLSPDGKPEQILPIVIVERPPMAKKPGLEGPNGFLATDEEKGKGSVEKVSLDDLEKRVQFQDARMRHISL